MSREIVAASYVGTNPKYRTFIEQRNGKLAEEIAKYQGRTFGDTIDQYDPRFVYMIAPTNLDSQAAKPYNIETPEDFYGLMTPDGRQVGKTILHESNSVNKPPFYSSETARALQDFVLPGYSAFSSADAICAYKKMDTNRYGCRLKLPSESDGNGQHPISEMRELEFLLKNELCEEDIASNGVVLEPNVVDPKTLSVGFFTLNGTAMGFVGEQIDIKDANGKNSFGGANLIVASGGIEELQEIVTDEKQQKAINYVRGFIGTFMNYGVVASRLSVDCLFGKDQYGDDIQGCTDITGRVGGTCPALILAAHEFKRDPGLRYAKSSVYLNYDPGEGQKDYEDNAELFVDHPKLRITARVESKG